MYSHLFAVSGGVVVRVRVDGRGIVVSAAVALVFAEESPDLERLGGAHEVLEALLLDADLAVVHEAQQRRQVRLADVAQDHDRVLARVRLQGGRDGSWLGC